MTKSRLQHRPIRKPRDSNDGEQVYASMWAVMMAEEWRDHWFDDDEPTPLEIVLEEMPFRIGQRHATVCATFVCWLGCNMGSALVHAAKRDIAAGRADADKAYFLAWQSENRRLRHVNHGVRTVEYMLAPDDLYRKSTHVLSVCESPLIKLPELSAEDLETIDQLLLWLPGDRGQAFIRQCETEIDRLRDEERRRKAAEFDRLYGASGRAA